MAGSVWPVSRADVETKTYRAGDADSVYDAIIFDNDGVLVEPPAEADLVSAARRAFESFGVSDPDPADISDVYRGVTPTDLERITDRHGIDPAGFWAARDRYAAAAQQASVRAGRTTAYEDAVVVRELSVPAAVVSSNQQETVDFLLEQFDLTDAFVSGYGRQPTLMDLRRKKPNPYMVEQALWDVAGANGGVERALMVGDNESDVRAAHAAGIDAAYLRREHCDDDLAVDPEYTFDGLDELASLLTEAGSEKTIADED